MTLSIIKKYINAILSENKYNAPEKALRSKIYPGSPFSSFLHKNLSTMDRNTIITPFISVEGMDYPISVSTLVEWTTN